MADSIDLATALFGKKQIEGESTKVTTSTMYGTAVGDSSGGTVLVSIDGDVTTGEGTPRQTVDADGNIVVVHDDTDNNVLELPTSPNVKEGDAVAITVVGGASKNMMVTSVEGSGDRLDAKAGKAVDKTTMLYKVTANTFTAVEEPAVADIGTYYEAVGDKYQLTTDTELKDGKTYYTSSVTIPPAPTEETEETEWSEKEPLWEDDTQTLFVCIKTEKVDGSLIYSPPAEAVSWANMSIVKNQIISTVQRTTDALDVRQTRTEQTADNLTITLTRTNDQLGELLARIIAGQDAEGNPTLTLDASGTGTSGMKAVISNTKLAFNNGIEDLSYMSGDTMYITRVEILAEQRLGLFEWQSRQNGNLGLRWVG